MYRWNPRPTILKKICAYGEIVSVCILTKKKDRKRRQKTLQLIISGYNASWLIVVTTLLWTGSGPQWVSESESDKLCWWKYIYEGCSKFFHLENVIFAKKKLLSPNFRELHVYLSRYMLPRFLRKTWMCDILKLFQASDPASHFILRQLHLNIYVLL